MDAFVKLNPEERRIFFEGTATPRNMQAQIVEKDFWVCWTLKELFDLPVIGEHLIFKGGTSLSKVFKVIERFSEDIDVSIDRGFLGFGEANEPEAAGYLRRVVKIEMGARSDHWPCETKPVTPYVAEQFPQGFREPSCDVKVLSVERTFWEKATILHAEFYRPVDKPMPERFSRHYCDAYELIQKGVSNEATKRLELLTRVAEHQSLFVRSSWARYGEAA